MKAKRRNPEMGPLVVLARSRDLLLDPDPVSMGVLLDMLEEQGWTLDRLGELLVPDMAPSMLNEIAIGSGADLGYFEIERDERQSRNNRIGVAWSIRKAQSNENWEGYRLRLWINWRGVLWANDRNGSQLPMHIAGGTHEIGYFNPYGDAEETALVPRVSLWIAEARQQATLAAWRVAVELKRLRSQQLTAIQVIRELAARAAWRSSYDTDPPGKLVASSTFQSKAVHQNPPMPEPEFLAEIRRLLLDEDPATVSVIQDMLLERGETLVSVSMKELGTSEQLLGELMESVIGEPPALVGAFEITKPGRQRPVPHEYTLPAFWASYLINGDASGMDDLEVDEIDRWLARVEPGHAVNVSDETWFAHGHDANRNQGADVATFTFLKYEDGKPEGTAWYARATESGRKFYAYVLITSHGEGTVMPTGMRHDTLEAAARHGAMIAWRGAAILKLHRDEDESARLRALFARAASPTHDIGIEIPDEIINGPVLTTGGDMPKQNPKRTRTVDEQVAANKIRAQFIELLQDPDPSALDTARDLLLEHGVKLADLAHSLAVNGASNWASPTKGWAGDFPSGTTGELVIKGAVDIEATRDFAKRSNEAVQDPDYIAVAWMIWKTRVRTPSTGERNQEHKLAYTSEIQINYRGQQWIENRNGANGLGLNDATPIGTFGGSTLEIAERRTIDMAWNICRVIKMLDGAPAMQIQNAFRGGVEMVKTPPALINPARELRANPAWVTHALADAFESLNSQVQPSWLPKLDDVRGGPRGTLVAAIKEYGCGAYGCVLPTLDENVVLKVTTDETEADFASQIAADLVAPICVEYYMAVSLAARHEGRPIYLLWRESADDVGAIDRVLGAKAEELVLAQHQAAQAAYLLLHHGQPAQRELKHWELLCERMRAEPELEALSKGLLQVYREQRIFFGDVHAGNLGRVFRDEATGQWVITDPGHVAVLE